MVDPYASRVAIALATSDPVAFEAARDWYARARSEARRMAATTGHTLAQACGVISALSPREKWERNLALAEALLAGNEVRTMQAKIKAAERIAAGERPLDVLNGPKVRAFYRNLTGDDNAVTIDVHAAAAAGHIGAVTHRNYGALERAYRWAASLFGLTPAQAQSVVWFTQRRLGQYVLFDDNAW